MNKKKKQTGELRFNRKLSGLKYLKINIYYQEPMITDLWKWIREKQSWSYDFQFINNTLKVCFVFSVDSSQA